MKRTLAWATIAAACLLSGCGGSNGTPCEGDSECESGFCKPNAYVDDICTKGFNCGHGGTCAAR
jgi:hypothetical protein